MQIAVHVQGTGNFLVLRRVIVTNKIVAGDKRERKFLNHLNTYYDQVIQQFEHADGIVILGPGEAKGESDKRITSKEMRRHILLVETADRLTKPQLVAKVRACFQSSNHIA